MLHCPNCQQSLMETGVTIYDDGERQTAIIAVDDSDGRLALHVLATAPDDGVDDGDDLRFACPACQTVFDEDAPVYDELLAMYLP